MQCVICREDISPVQQYGYCAYVTRSNVHAYAHFRMHMSQAIAETDPARSEILNRHSDLSDPVNSWRQG